MTCGLCRFFSGQTGECRRYPPTKEFQNEYRGRYAVWLSVDSSDWCGEFQSKNDEKTLREK